MISSRNYFLFHRIMTHKGKIMFNYTSQILIILCLFSGILHTAEAKTSVELSNTEILKRVKYRFPMIYKKFEKQQTDEPEKFAENMDIIRKNMKKRRQNSDDSRDKNRKFKKGRFKSKSLDKKDKIKNEIKRLAEEYKDAPEGNKEIIRSKFTEKVTQAFDATTKEREQIIAETEKKLDRKSVV